DHPYRYGLFSLEYSTEALSNGFFELLSISARLPDGTLIELGPDATPDRRNLAAGVAPVPPANLSSAFDSTAVVRVYIGVPRQRQGGPNVSVRNGHPASTRFVRRDLLLQDESDGGNDQE